MQAERKDYTKHILMTTGKTLICFISAVLLIAVIVFSAAPTVAVDFYTALGQENTAYRYTVKAGKTDAQWAYKAASAAIQNEYSDKEIAKQCKHFLLIDDGCVAESVDEYNLSRSPSASYDVLLYSVQNYFAEYVAKETKEIFDGAQFLTPRQALESELSLKQRASVANQLSVILLQDVGGVQEFLQGLLGELPSQSELLTLYALRAAARLSKATSVSVSYGGKPVDEAYRQAFDAYVAHRG